MLLGERGLDSSPPNCAPCARRRAGMARGWHARTANRTPFDLISGWKTKTARVVAGLPPDSGNFSENAHTCVMQKSVTLGCRLRRRWPLLLIALSGLFALTASSLDLRINTTASMPIGLYRSVPPRLERGVWVAFCLPEESAQLGRSRAYLRGGSCPDGSQELLKEIVAVPGDKVVLTHTGLIVNGDSIPGSALRPVDGGGRILAHAPFGQRCVAPGELWVLGLDRRVSWDSRYFGPVPSTKSGR